MLRAFSRVKSSALGNYPRAKSWMCDGNFPEPFGGMN
jgi:hypothetical protein